MRPQLAARLLRALSGDGDDLAAALDTVLALAFVACPSCVAVSLTLDPGGMPVTVVAFAGARRRRAASMTVRFPRPTTNGSGLPPAVLVVFASDDHALARLAVDITAQLTIDPSEITLTADADVPQPTDADLVLAGQLADRSTVDRALGVLLDQGWALTDGRAELQRRADTTGTSLVGAAAVVLGPLTAAPGHPPQGHRSPPTGRRAPPTGRRRRPGGSRP